MRRSAKNKSEYTRLICHYIQKRDMLKEQGIKYSDPKYVRVQTRIDSWRRAIRQLDETKDRIREINERVRYAYDMSMYRCTGISMKTDRALIRMMFCKYLLQQNFLSKNIAEFVGWKRQATVFDQRLLLNELLKKDDMVKQKWQYFKKRMERQLPKQQRA